MHFFLCAGFMLRCIPPTHSPTHPLTHSPTHPLTYIFFWFASSYPLLFFLCNSRPAAERRGYTSVFNALARIAKEEGVLTLWRVCATCSEKEGEIG